LVGGCDGGGVCGLEGGGVCWFGGGGVLLEIGVVAL